MRAPRDGVVRAKVCLLNKFSLVTGTEEKSDKSALRENSGIVNLAGLDRQSLLRISIPSSHLPNRYSRAS